MLLAKTYFGTDCWNTYASYAFKNNVLVASCSFESTKGNTLTASIYSHSLPLLVKEVYFPELRTEQKTGYNDD